MFEFSYRNNLSWKPIYDGIYTVEIFPEREREQIMKQTTLSSEGEMEILHRQVFIASGGPEWNEKIPSMDDRVYALPDSFSNVEGGLGYLVGIYSKVIPYKTCRNDDAELVSCPAEKPFW